MAKRIAALAVGVLVVAALVGQYHSLLPEVASRPPMAKIWVMAGFFTILTNAAIGAMMLACAAGAGVSSRLSIALLVAILLTFAIYHTVLAQLWAPEGLAWWADQALHTAVPLAYLIWWLAFGDKRLGWAAMLPCLAWPLVYCVYAMTRGALSGFWAYPFLNAEVLSVAELARNIAALTLAFAAVSVAIIGLARRWA